MDVRVVIIIAGLFSALVGCIFLAPDLFGFLKLPDGFVSLGWERQITALALMLIGALGVLSETMPEKKRRRSASPYALHTMDPEPADAPLTLTADQPDPVPERDTPAPWLAEDFKPAND
ncbi:MAG: hypothetical protein ACXWVH_07225 [Caulobacteraceae bacterium]